MKFSVSLIRLSKKLDKLTAPYSSFLDNLFLDDTDRTPCKHQPVVSVADIKSIMSRAKDSGNDCLIYWAKCNILPL